MAQTRVVGGAPVGNLARATCAIAEAAAGGADIVVLPEALDLGWADPCALELAQPIPGTSSDPLCRAAAEHGIWACAGIIERDGTQIYNSAVLIDRDGGIRIKHRKINELDFAQAIYSTGDGATVVDTEFGRIGVMICADAFIESLTVSRSLARQGADFIFSPCAWAVPADHDNEADPYGQLWIDSYAPVCRDNSLWIAGVSNVGPITGGEWSGRKCIGCSMLVGPGGEVVARAPYGEGAEALVVHDIARRL